MASRRTPEVHLGIDVGTQGVRAVAVDPRGHLVARGASPLPVGRRSGHRHEQDPADWWSSLVRAVAETTSSLPDGCRVVSLALDATSGTVLVEDAAGQPCGPALMYDDARAAAQSTRVATAGRSLWQELGYRMQPSWALPKVLWLLATGAVPPGGRVVHQADHLLGRLVGGRVPTDTSTALKTGVDLRTATWPADLLADLAVPVGILPEVVLPGTRIGTVGTEAAGLTGLPRGALVRAGMTDGCAAQIASGALRPGSWSSALGTTLVLKGSTEKLLQDPSGAVYSHRHPDGGWLPGGASSTGAGVLADRLPGADLAALSARAVWQPQGETVYPLVGRGERFPFVAKDAHGFGEAAGGDEEQLVALCYGIACVERLAYDVLGALGADVSGPVALTGGTTANLTWAQLRTDLLARPTYLPRLPDAAIGMAVLAAAPPGRLTETADRMVSIDLTLTPDDERGKRLRPGYERLVGELVDRRWLDADLATRALAVRP